MKFSIKQWGADQPVLDCLVIGILPGGQISESAVALNVSSLELVHTVLEEGDLASAVGSTLLLRPLSDSAPKRILLVRVGEREKGQHKEDQDFLAALSASFRTLISVGVQRVGLFLGDFLLNRSVSWQLSSAVLALADVQYRSDQRKSSPAPSSDRLSEITFFVGQGQQALAEEGLAFGNAVAAGMKLTRDLGNLPPNLCTPTYLASKAEGLSEDLGLSENLAFSVEVLDESAMTLLGMGALLAVAEGSEEEAKLIVVHYTGGKPETQPIVLVGKGVTFDSGGISIKPGELMDEMKYDMCGAAAVLGTLEAVARLKLPIRVIGVLVASENMPSGRACRPGDIVTSMSGKTIEILNTDAEGRLLLCDALHYVKRFNPSMVIDIATLTGACVIALGSIYSGLYTREDTLADALLRAAEISGDGVWRMPLQEDYAEQLKSNFADLANIGGRPAGSVTAAVFLSRFTEGYRWAHLDVAGTAWKSGPQKGATGRPVPLLVEFLRSCVDAQAVNEGAFK